MSQSLSRRTLLTAAGVTASAAAIVALPATAAYADGDASDLLVRNFCASWTSRDPDLVASFFSENVIWLNVAIPPAMVGRAAARAFFAAGFDSTTFLRATISQQVAKQGRVMHERVDSYHFIGSDHDVNLKVMGSFVVANNKIVQWNDYWDLAQSEFGPPC